MSETEDGGPAFAPNGAPHPTDPTKAVYGMTLRDWFAGQAMLPTFMLALETIKANPSAVKYDEHSLAAGAYKYADAMLAARKPTP